MGLLLEQYNEINNTLKSINDKLQLAQKRVALIDDKINGEIPQRIANLEEQLEKIDEYKLKIEGFRRLAEKNLDSKNVLTIETPPGYRVNLNRLRNWAMMIDPMSTNDPYAQRVYVVAKCDEYFLNQKKAEFTERIAQLKQDFENGSTNELMSIQREIAEHKEALKECAQSEQINKFVKDVVEVNGHYIFEEAPVEFNKNTGVEDIVAPGAIGLPFSFDKEQNKILKSQMGKFYDEKGGRVYIPFEEISLESDFGITVSCIPSRKRLSEMDSGIRNLLLNVIDKSEAGSRKIYVIDAERRNSSIVGVLKDLEGTFALANVPRSKEQITSTLEEIVSSFSDIDEHLEHYDTVVEYNNAMSSTKRIERKVIVLVGGPKAFTGKDSEFVNRILANYERYGISFICVNIKSDISKSNDFGLSEYLTESITHINMTNSDTTLTHGNGSARKFAWYTYKLNLPESYTKSVKEKTVDRDVLGNEYTKRYSLDSMPEYKRGNKKITLPFGVNGKDEVKSISFNDENFASFLMGASGSGKSTLIHTLITGIINNYHPDDVELWLADFKMSEFAQYINPRPPHIKYILLDESKELVYDLVDKLTDIMMTRQRFFMNNKGLKKKVEEVPSSTYMPVIFVIFDEFSIMSQAVAESESYKLKLQNLLAKGRALGIKFLFASQTFSKGVSGLTGTAKEQIQSRIAMKNSREEIVDTLQLSSNMKTEQVTNWMDALPAHYALYKYRKGDSLEVQRLHALYFEGTGEDTYAKQKDLINRINANMSAVDISEYNPDNNSFYVDKDPVIVDGNSYSVFDADKLTKGIGKISRHNEMGCTGDEIYLDLGVPRLMVNQKLISMLPESRENILLLGRPNEYPCCASVIMSVIEQAKLQNTGVVIWTYGRNRLYLEYKNAFIAANIEIVEGTEAICQAIKREKDNILSKNYEKKFIILLGMDRICVDFQYQDGNSGVAVGNSINSEIASVLNKATNNNEKSEAEQLQDEIRSEVRKRLSAIKKELRNAGKQAGKSKEEIDAEIDAERTRLYAEVEAEFSTALEFKAGDVLVQEAVPVKSSMTDGGAYNATDDFKFIMKQASRNGIHFVMMLNSIADIKAMGVNQDEFRHKVAFQLSVDDSRNVFQNKDASSIPEHVCLYDDTIERFSLRPYLYRGITWDGWYVSEDGKIVDPLND